MDLFQQNFPRGGGLFSVRLALIIASLTAPALGQWNYLGSGIEQFSYSTGSGTGPTIQLSAPGGYGLGTIQFFTYYNQTVPSAQWSAEDLGNFTADQTLSTSVGGGANQPLAARLTIKGASGYVGIGTTTPAHLLHVAGTIGAEEVIVSSTGADYVFDPSYRLKPLSEVKRYIDENHHLPEIPSASDVSTNGLGLGEMQSKLLAKIEELTLHMIRAEERSAALEEEGKQLRAEIGALRDRIERDAASAPHASARQTIP